MSLQDNCIILCKIDVCQNLDKGKPITVTTAVAITETVMVTVPVMDTVYHQLLSILNMSLRDNCVILRKIYVNQNLDKGKLLL